MECAYEQVEISFVSHGRRFHLRLRRDVETISSEVQVVQPSHISQPLHTNHLYHGSLAGQLYCFNSVIATLYLIILLLHICVPLCTRMSIEIRESRWQNDGQMLINFFLFQRITYYIYNAYILSEASHNNMCNLFFR